MVRRTKEEALATRESLLDAAERVFSEQGVTRTTLAEVAAAAGVTRGAVYWHFRDKAELFGAMCSRATLRLETALEAAARDDAADPLKALRDVMVDELGEIATNPRTRNVLEILLHKCERAGEIAEAGPRREEIERHCLCSVGTLMQRAVERGQLPAGTDPRATAFALHAYFVGLVQTWLLDPSALDLGRAAPSLVDAMFAGLRASAPREAGTEVPAATA